MENIVQNKLRTRGFPSLQTPPRRLAARFPPDATDAKPTKNFASVLRRLRQAETARAPCKTG